jgi:hypothetical protein
MADRWQTKLSRPIVMRDGTRLETLAEAGQFILALPEGDQQRNSWTKATELLMQAAERKGNIEAATEAVERAGFIQMHSRRSARWLSSTPLRLPFRNVACRRRELGPPIGEPTAGLGDRREFAPSRLTIGRESLAYQRLSITPDEVHLSRRTLPALIFSSSI